MEEYNLESDIKIFYVTAQTFPEGIMEAHEKLHSLIPSNDNRNFYAVSRPENWGVIIYKSGVEELYDGEAEKFGCETMTILKGKYISTYISNYADNIKNIENAFVKMLQTPGLDPYGYCVEMYIGKSDVRCMVRLKD